MLTNTYEHSTARQGISLGHVFSKTFMTPSGQPQPPSYPWSSDITSASGRAWGNVETDFNVASPQFLFWSSHDRTYPTVIRVDYNKSIQLAPHNALGFQNAI